MQEIMQEWHLFPRHWHHKPHTKCDSDFSAMTNFEELVGSQLTDSFTTKYTRKEMHQFLARSNIIKINIYTTSMLRRLATCTSNRKTKNLMHNSRLKTVGCPMLVLDLVCYYAESAQKHVGLIVRFSYFMEDQTACNIK